MEKPGGFFEASIINKAKKGIDMTLDEKKKCAEVWEMVSGEKTNAKQWCEAAGDALSEMMASMRACSKAMKHVPRPSGSRPGYGWIVNYVYQVLKQRYGMNKSQIFQGCFNVSYSNWRSHITITLGSCN
ncbi:MAG: hypothetical protein KKD44_07310 [Proteobacteria bacterium]|nr:hypothetical protein [Pseudomonadota bacterium]